MSILWLGYYLLISSVVLPLLSRHMGFGEGMFAVLLAFGFGIGSLVSQRGLLSRRDMIVSSVLILPCLAVGGRQNRRNVSCCAGGSRAIRSKVTRSEFTR